MKPGVRGACVLAVLIVPVMAGCFTGRSRKAAGAGPTMPVVPPAATPAPSADTARRTGMVADSARHADSVRAAATADSATKQAAAKTADSLTRTADSLKVKKARKPAPVSKPCVLDFSESPPETRLTYTRIDSANATTYIGGGFVGHCQGENNRISADSAEQFQLVGVLNLFGNVVYQEPGKTRIQSAHATYFTREERLFADGMVTAFQIPTGSTFTGPSMEYFRPTATRLVSKLVAPNNPTATLIEKDSAGNPGVPVRIAAATMIDQGDSLLFAVGSVTITRGGLTGRSDSATFDKVTELARLIRSARVVNKDSSKRFTLDGDTIDLFSTDRQLTRVLALHQATAVSSDVTIRSERIDLRLDKQKLSEAFAHGGGRAKAHTPQQDVVADSLHILMPDQRVSEMRAVGTAVATGIPDTLKIKSDDRDLLRGDTVVARFDSSRFSGDTAQPRIREINARGHASSLFQVASKQGPTFPPSINYSRGKAIRVQFDSGAVRDVTIDSAASGAFFEPAADSLSDTTRKQSKRKAAPAPTTRRRGAAVAAASRPVTPDRPKPNPRSPTPLESSPLPSPAFRRPP